MLFRSFKINGDYIFCDTGAGSPVGDTDVRPKYIFIGFNTIITYGIGGIKPFFITKMTPTEMSLIYDGTTYSFTNSKYYN